MKIVYLLGIALGVLYVLNPTAGVFELIPDNVPVFGNLDEAAAFALILTCWRKLRPPKRSQETVQSPPRND